VILVTLVTPADVILLMSPRSPSCNNNVSTSSWHAPLLCSQYSNAHAHRLNSLSLSYGASPFFVGPRRHVTRELVTHLLVRPRATLAVADIARLEEEAQAPLMAKYEHIVAHTRALFEGAGRENVAFERFTSAKKEGRDVQFFLAGTKPGT
jgi:hypothetical protein